MTKKYNLFSKSDMKRFSNDLEKEIYSNVEQQIYARSYDVECPHCHTSVSVPAGKSYCPFCQNEIDLQLNVSWK